MSQRRVSFDQFRSRARAAAAIETEKAPVESFASAAASWRAFMVVAKGPYRYDARGAYNCQLADRHVDDPVVVLHERTVAKVRDLARCLTVSQIGVVKPVLGAGV